MSRLEGKEQARSGKLHTNTRVISETDVERQLTEGITALGGKCLKFTTPNYTGVPDRIILLPGGRVAFAELKRPGEKERRRQELVQTKFRTLGFTVFSSVDSADKINKVLDYCREVAASGRIHANDNG